MDREQEKQVIDITYKSTPGSFNRAWGWRIQHNPEREPGSMTEAEQEVKRTAAEGKPQKREVSRCLTYTYWVATR